MEENRQSRKNRKTIAAVVAVASVAVILFVCIFSLYHLPERDPVETPAVNEDATVAALPAEDFQETNDIMSASQQEVSEMLGQLEMQYENAKLNGEPFVAQQDGLRLALAYRQAGETQKAIDFTKSLISENSYDSVFINKCEQFLKTLDSSPR